MSPLILYRRIASKEAGYSDGGSDRCSLLRRTTARHVTRARPIYSTRLCNDDSFQDKRARASRTVFFRRSAPPHPLLVYRYSFFIGVPRFGS